MSWECKYLVNGNCLKVNTECDPGMKGCVLRGVYEFPYRDDSQSKTTDPKAK